MPIAPIAAHTELISGRGLLDMGSFFAERPDLYSVFCTITSGTDDVDLTHFMPKLYRSGNLQFGRRNNGETIDVVEDIFISYAQQYLGLYLDEYNLTPYNSDYFEGRNVGRMQQLASIPPLTISTAANTNAEALNASYVGVIEGIAEQGSITGNIGTYGQNGSTSRADFQIDLLYKVLYPSTYYSGLDFKVILSSMKSASSVGYVIPPDVTCYLTIQPYKFSAIEPPVAGP